MPLDVRGCTRATLKASACALSVPCLKRLGNPLNRLRAWDRDLQLSPLNEEFPVGASHQLASITSLPFVHTARRYYRSNDVVRSSDWRLLGSPFRRVEELVCREEDQTGSFRGSKSRNKVSVGEPAEGSLPMTFSRPRKKCSSFVSLTSTVLMAGGPPVRRPRQPDAAWISLPPLSIEFDGAGERPRLPPAGRSAVWRRASRGFVP